MSKSRLYGWNGEYPEKQLSGQALIVFNGMRAEPDQLKTGHAWTDTIGKELRTRQDPYRVVLYYILVLKSRGVIRTNEFDIDAVTKNGDAKHAITVKTAATIDERFTVLPETPTEREVPDNADAIEAVHDMQDAVADDNPDDDGSEDAETEEIAESV